jgi:signal transduction histidine kinase
MVKDEFSPQLDVRQIGWSQPQNMPEIRADRLSLLRVFRNLVDNALKYGGEDLSEISIGYHEQDGFHVVSVSDDGVGIKGKDSKKIFEVFQRDRTSVNTDGTGLGLAIVKEVAKQHGGTVTVESGPGKGTTFYISISRQL